MKLIMILTLSLHCKFCHLCIQFGPRSGPTGCWVCFGSKLFDTVIVFQKEFFEKVNFEQDQTPLWTCVAGAHLQCVNNHYAKFEYKGMKCFNYRLHTNKQCKHSKGDIPMSKFNNPKNITKCAQSIGSHMFNV